ncbi:MAG: hypothetical protein OES09_14245 [Gammaproteobacteria bacterium]|nr:hypothetical protein [Gammaproteobacteria bacterium]
MTRRILSVTALILISIIFATVLAEFIARMLESDDTKRGNFYNIPHEALGWVPKPNSQAVMETSEYIAHYTINEDAMNDTPTYQYKNSKRRLVAIGDSHTFALGVDMSQAWPNVLENLLFGEDSEAGTVFNLGVIGYNLGQYYDWLKLNEERLSPNTLIIGFSMATDLYDLIPPRKGGFVYGRDKDRYYYDLADDGTLYHARSNIAGTREPATDVRSYLNHLALYRLIKRSKLAYWLSVRISPRGRSLWPGLDTALKKELVGDDAYRWQLAERVLTALAGDVGQRVDHIILVVIPYLAQVYDEVWEASFGGFPGKYDRWIGNDRLREICKRLGIEFVDTTPDFISQTQATGEWLHYRYDGHPNPLGHKIIAAAIARHWRMLQAH